VGTAVVGTAVVGTAVVGTAVVGTAVVGTAVVGTAVVALGVIGVDVSSSSVGCFVTGGDTITVGDESVAEMVGDATTVGVFGIEVVAVELGSSTIKSEIIS